MNENYFQLYQSSKDETKVSLYFLPVQLSREIQYNRKQRAPYRMTNDHLTNNSSNLQSQNIIETKSKIITKLVQETFYYYYYYYYCIRLDSNVTISLEFYGCKKTFIPKIFISFIYTIFIYI